MRFLLALLALALLPAAAHAEWLEASSEHFVVYADDSERDMRKFSEQLERYHAAMELMTGVDSETPSPSNRVTVFIVKNQREVQELLGGEARNIGGFYIPRAGGSVAFVPRIELRRGETDQSMLVLLHEYAHHFLISNSGFPMPRWAGEGAAEVFAAAEFDGEGGVRIGLAAHHRAPELFLAEEVTAAELLDPELYAKRHGRRYDAFYGKSWLLYHYLTFAPERKGQLRAYLQAIAGGKTSREAGEAVFGDLAALERDLQAYLRRPTITSLRYRPEALAIGPVSIRRLTAGEAAIMPVRIRSKRGVDEERAREVLADARKIAARFPGDAAVLDALAEAEFDAGNDAEAIAAADAAIALDPGRPNPYVQKGYALFSRAAEADDPVRAYRAAAAPFIALNKLEADHPLPLMYYFRSFAESGRTPPEEAVLGLKRAAELAPFDLSLRMMVAVHELNAGRLAQARWHLVPIAFSPHPDAMSEPARAVIERIDAGTEADPQALLQLLAGASIETADEAAAGS